MILTSPINNVHFVTSSLGQINQIIWQNAYRIIHFTRCLRAVQAKKLQICVGNIKKEILQRNGTGIHSCTPVIEEIA